MLISILVLYFTRTVHIPTDQVGLALSFGAICGLLVAIPAGRLADAVGPRGTTVGLLCLLGIIVCGYPFVDSFTGLMVMSGLVLATESAAFAADGALIAGLIPSGERVRAISFMRATSNLSIVIGAAAGSIGLFLDRHGVYIGLLLGAGALYLAAGLAFLRVPKVIPVKHDEEGPIWPVLRDAPYAVVSLINSVLIMNAGILTVALPIWISQRTNAPTWLFPMVVIINAVTVVLFQVRASKSSAEVPGGAKALRLAGFLLAACCALFALAAGQPTWLAVVVLLTGAFVHVAGEMFHAAGSWSLSYGLAAEHAQGQYQGLFGMSSQLGQLITPALAAILLTRLGYPGWLIFAGLFLIAGAAAPAVARWAQRTRDLTSPQPTQ